MSKNDQPGVQQPIFEDTSTGRIKREIWEASDEQIDAILTDYGIPSPSEWTKEGTYIQTTVRHKVVENRRKNDIVFIPMVNQLL